MVGRHVTGNSSPSLKIPFFPKIWPVFSSNNANISNSDVVGTTETSSSLANSNSNITSDVLVGTTVDEDQELSLFSLIDLEQAIEHVTELIVNPSLLSRNSSLAGMRNCNNTHLLVDGKVQ